MIGLQFNCHMGSQSPILDMCDMWKIQIGLFGSWSRISLKIPIKDKLKISAILCNGAIKIYWRIIERFDRYLLSNAKNLVVSFME